MTRAFNIEGLVRLQNYMGGKTLSDAQFFAVLNADVVEMIDGEESTTKRRYFRIAENDESITFSCILGSSQQQMVVTKATKQLNVSTTSILSGQPGSITSEMLADKAVTRKKLNDAAVGSEALGNASVTSVKINDGAVTTAKIADGAVLSGKIATSSIESVKIANGAVTSEKLAPGLDVSGLFFTLPEGAQLPYTLTEEDKTKISAATILMLPTTNGVIPFQRGPKTARLWCSLEYVSTFWVVTVSESSISAPVAYKIVDDTAVKFTPQTLTGAQKTQARTNIGAAEAPNTSGDSQATLEEPPVADEKTIP